MESTSLGLYVLASLALIATPGQDMLFVITRSLAQGRLAGVCSAVGVIIGILVHTALAAGSLSERVLRRPAALAWVNRASGGVLVALGLRLAATDR